MTTTPEQPGSYWYADDDARSTSVMEAMRSYRAAEVAMRRRTQQAMEMGENELLVLRFLARARLRGSVVTPGPDKNSEITTSSNDKVKLNSQAAMIDGAIVGSVTR